jgi:TetR/AcrR family transcriptional regulator, regulator of cefoperazone and chloramphenicol sensitivity
MARSSKQQIIETALKIMGEQGIEGITTRRIAEAANVNTAALNYHFSSKQTLIEEAIGSFITELTKIFEPLGDKKNAKENLRIFLNSFIEYALAYPGITKSLFFQMAIQDGPNLILATAMKHNFDLLKDNLRQNSGVTSEKTLSFMALETMSALIYPLMLNRHLREVSLIDFSNPTDRTEYTNLLIMKISGE